MNTYDKFPPCDFLLNMLKTIPESTFTYLQAYTLRNNKNEFYILKSDCRSVLLISPTVFRNQILPLAARGMCGFEESEKAFLIDLNISA